jgi:hypothetical protein
MEGEAMTENDEGAVIRWDFRQCDNGWDEAYTDSDGSWVRHADHERIVTALRARLAAAEGARDAVRASLGDGPGAQAEEIRRLRGSLAMVRKLASEDAMKLQAQRDQALTRLGEAEKMLLEASDKLEELEYMPTGVYDRIKQFLSRDSAGGMG